MPKLEGKTRAALIITHDVVMAALSFVISAYLRLGDTVFDQPSEFLLIGTAVFAAVAAAVFAVMRLYRNVWRYISLNEFFDILRAATLIILVFLPSMFLLTRLEALPRSVLVINWFVLVGLLAGSRIFYRLLHDRHFDREERGQPGRPVPVLLIGAGSSADMFIRAMTRNPGAGYRVVGILDEGSAFIGQRIQGVPVLGGLSDLERVVHRAGRGIERPQRLILTGERIDGVIARDLLDRAETLGLTLGRLPRLTAFRSAIEDGIDVKTFAVEDLLGRPQTVLDRKSMRALVADRRVLVTGAGGTIGGELVRQICDYRPAQIVLVDHSEFALYSITHELDERPTAPPRRAVLCDIRNSASLRRVIDEERPNLVFHAAALKHLPLVENNPSEGVLTNVIGTRNVAEACRGGGVEAMVLISTDKAVKPTSVMGATKRLAELYCLALARAVGPGDTRFVTVRFGNVLGSTGSVVPLFRRQLENGGPITVTDPEMTRYFMTTREAVELVLEASALGASESEHDPGIFVLDMGDPVSIDELARQMVRLAGLRPGEDIDIVYTGCRPGEKLHEELFHPDEGARPAEYPGLLIARPKVPALDTFGPGFEALAAAANAGDSSETLRLLRRLVPEYQPLEENPGVVVAMRS
ncbi:MAG: polysaccharide biosynthesis protein [Alphaproteobacteria bacterium]|nr:polysaccharide biosynthesis protein [Alphaproteobacteria bacterium]